MSNEPCRDDTYCQNERRHETYAFDTHTTAGSKTLVFRTFSCSTRDCEYPERQCRVKGNVK